MSDDTDRSRRSRTPVALPATPYTAACRRCGARLSLSLEEMLASLRQPPICWPCDSPDAASG